MRGTYIIIEGIDCAGKTTLLQNISSLLGKDYKLILSKHPGATPLGQHLRTLVKTPSVFNRDIKIDPYSAQLLMMVDQIAFCETILKPEIANGSLVIADRCNLISAIIYGLSEGLTINDLNKMYNLVNSPPPDQVFILSLPIDEVIRRKTSRGHEKDRFEDQGKKFLQNVCNHYDNILTINEEITVLLNSFVPLNRIKHIDATLSPLDLANQVATQIAAIADSNHGDD